MQTDWILDVLADLKTFAMSSDLPKLAAQLDNSAVVAMAEISALQERRLNLGHDNDKEIKSRPQGTGPR
ncbi:hypothetical protein JQT66_14530 [Sulfitobacter mediterraneus]|uniref:hypothetical protein n=1 Tax=Sulfitobacter mediterraneus TaxID=83219 RepID=UPI001268F001|nr:hypothetical protein [Sulfitobacter mediterraneus]MBM1311457.1 hypothetical protein [Sulfitobacter mediterraneus]MBM1315339.1 hypothetical protein [Sulfitobacter mediterraneus]MBM1323700.1 hypothetical protein [Sulfitobacter mediterraneus]MBM1327612.1 hypothetical protein [Sulfitobacter mediterraneus]MBM1398960.1 hypothetical protein [Sulfitobacter mediterraneus]